MTSTIPRPSHLRHGTERHADAMADHYSSAAKTFHWLTAGLVLTTVAIALIGAQLDLGPTKLLLLRIHLGLGVFVFVLTLARLAWRAGHRPPALPRGVTPARKAIIGTVHGALYLLLLGLPVTGLAITLVSGSIAFLLGLPPSGPPDFVASIPYAISHKVGAYVMISLLVAHIGAALAHHFVVRDRTLTRMLPQRKIDRPVPQAEVRRAA